MGDADTKVEETPEYVWTGEGVEYVKMKSPDPGSGVTKRQLKNLEMLREEGEEGDDIVQQALAGGIIETPAALDELRAIPLKDIKEELVKKHQTKMQAMELQDLVRELYRVRLDSSANTTSVPT